MKRKKVVIKVRINNCFLDRSVWIVIMYFVQRVAPLCLRTPLSFSLSQFIWFHNYFWTTSCLVFLKLILVFVPNIIFLNKNYARSTMGYNLWRIYSYRFFFKGVISDFSRLKSSVEDNIYMKTELQRSPTPGLFNSIWVFRKVYSAEIPELQFVKWVTYEDGGQLQLQRSWSNA